MQKLQKLLPWLFLFSILLGIVYVYKRQSAPSDENPDFTPYVAEKPTTSTQTTQRSDQGISGVVAEAQRGIFLEGVSVSLYRVAKPGESLSRPGGAIPLKAKRIENRSTSISGKFHFAIPEPGEYFLLAEHKDYATQESDHFQITAETAQLTIPLRLLAAATLEITASSQDHPLIGYKLLLLTRNKVLPREQETDKAGMATFAPLPPGDYWVRILPAGSETNFYYWQALQNDPPDPPDITLTEGEQKKWALLLEGEKPGKVSGTVYINGSIPSQPCLLEFQLTKRPPNLAPSMMKPVSVLTDSNGGFTVEKIASGEYKVLVRATNSLAALVVAEQKLQINPETETPLSISLSLGNFRGRVLDSEGKPRLQAQALFKSKNPGQAPLIESCWTDTEGIFRTQKLPLGSYELMIYGGRTKSQAVTIQLERENQDLGEFKLE